MVPHSFLFAKQGHSDEMKSYRITCAEGSFSCVDLYARAQQMPSPHHGGWHVTVWPSLSLSPPLSLSLSVSLSLSLFSFFLPGLGVVSRPSGA